MYLRNSENSPPAPVSQILRKQTQKGDTLMKKHDPLTESYFYILLCLYHQSKHGYGIMQDTEELSEGRVKIGSGTMYGAISNMIKKQWIEEKHSEGADDRRKRMYELTAAGRNVLDFEIKRLNELVGHANKVMGGEHYE